MRAFRDREGKGIGMKKVELLSPAGNFDALKGAIRAGADAVYLGGAHYGARAYAENFTKEEICRGIRLAHILGRKIYLTVNTLVKEKELDNLYDFLLPFYESGLDGVIVQDFGVLCYIRTYFPGLAIHASTQMTVTGSGGANFVKEQGISRIVPARELSLEEIKKIKLETGVEIEAFIHGAMCYCYSGQCLFSSILGGRSGNRGRCAQPCRLGYNLDGKNCYPLSMKDMCTIEFLPQLIDSGIDSFKIEGRMKKAAYAAGVTAIYRKYIDKYYQDKENFYVSEKDKSLLHSLYIRSETGDGYYRRMNGKEMISLKSPAYSATDEQLLKEIEKKYIDGQLYQDVEAKLCLKVGEPVSISLQKNAAGVYITGDVVQKAQKQPLTKENIKEKIQKGGESFIKAEQINIDMEDNVFLPVRSLNELRRKATTCMEMEIIRQNGFDFVNERKSLPPGPKEKREVSCVPSLERQIQVSVHTAEQLWAALDEKVSRIYLDYSLLDKKILDRLRRSVVQLFIASPYVVRAKDILYLKKIKAALSSGVFDGVLVRNLESYHFFTSQDIYGKNCLNKKCIPEKIVLDANFYLWNRESVNFWKNQADEFYLPLELNGHEWQKLLGMTGGKTFTASAVVYGRLPVMITANCLKKTMGKCNKKPGMVILGDRYKKQFPVYTDCQCCYNVIYNSVPLSLHKMFALSDCPVSNFRLDFTFEKGEDTADIIRYFKEILVRYKEPFYKEYTTGHYKRGVE